MVFAAITTELEFCMDRDFELISIKLAFEIFEFATVLFTDNAHAFSDQEDVRGHEINPYL